MADITWNGFVISTKQFGLQTDKEEEEEWEEEEGREEEGKEDEDAINLGPTCQ